MTVQTLADARGIADSGGGARAAGGRHGAAAAAAAPSPVVLPAVSAAEGAAINAFYRNRAASAFSLAGRAATMTASWPAVPPDGAARWRVELSVDDVAGALIVPRSLVEALLAGLDPDDGRLDNLAPAHAALVLEFALADALAALEAGIGARLALTAVVPATDPLPADLTAPTPLTFALAVDDGGRPTPGELLLQPAHAARLAGLINRNAAGTVPAVDLPVPVHLRVAATTCPVSEIATLSPGDIVMADDRCRQARTAVAVVAEHLAALVALTAAGAQFAARPERGRGSAWEWSMENKADGSQSDLHETDIDDIPVKLLFELGRIEIPLAEVRQLAPGAVIATPRPVDDSVDIVANGRRIGRGSLVQIGGNLGVRITRLFHYG